MKDDGLSPARGIFYGLILSAACWIALALLIFAAVTA
jgi:hypothetical protein